MAFGVLWEIVCSDVKLVKFLGGTIVPQTAKAPKMMTYTYIFKERDAHAHTFYYTRYIFFLFFCVLVRGWNGAAGENPCVTYDFVLLREVERSMMLLLLCLDIQVILMRVSILDILEREIVNYNNFFPIFFIFRAREKNK